MDEMEKVLERKGEVMAKVELCDPIPHKTYRLPPAGLPAGWQEKHGKYPPEEARVFIHRDGLAVMVSKAQYGDGRWWLHVSMSRAKRIPTYEDMATVKKLFVGDDREAVQVFPKASKHVNINPYCLHLFSCDDDGVLPDFTHGSGSI